MKLNAKYVTFSAISLASLYVLYHNERFLIDGSHPAWQHYAPFKWWLLPHGIFGAIVLLFAPLQFSERLRQRFTSANVVANLLQKRGDRRRGCKADQNFERAIERQPCAQQRGKLARCRHQVVA